MRKWNRLSNNISFDKNTLRELTKARDYLCEYYEHKCYTSYNGKCPMTDYFCFEYPSLSSLFSRTSGMKKVNIIINHLIKSAKAVGYEVTE
jgi:hypothetical protein